ncbi:MAG: hypothetical protein J5906_09230 [Acidaminococcaceae bacterium]|nr:hypothetical protein [Acidaminococcaceae bacterium]
MKKKKLKKQFAKLLKSAESGNAKTNKILLEIRLFNTDRETSKIKTGGMVINPNNITDDESRELVTGDVLSWD